MPPVIPFGIPDYFTGIGKISPVNSTLARFELRRNCFFKHFPDSAGDSIANSGEIIWYSERDNWGHLYLYDAITGKAKNKITEGDYMVTRLLKVDEKNHLLYFLADGLDLKNPYFTHLYKIGFDGKQFMSLTPEEGNHTITFSPSERYFIDSYSQPEVPPVIVLRNTD